MPSKLLKTPVLPDKYYHIFNRANNNELIFKDHEDYTYFLQELGQVVAEKIDIFAFCLMPDHFHLLIKPKFDTRISGQGSIQKCFRMLFQLYAQYFNKKYSRKGSLFYKSFRRIEVKEEYYLKYLLFYIHYNPQKALLTKSFTKYQYSSFKFYITNKETKLRKDIVLEWFYNDMKEFVKFHTDCLEMILGTPALGLESLFPLPLQKLLSQ